MQTGIIAFSLAAMIVVVALAGLYLTRRWFPHPVRQANNEVAGFLLAVLGVMYGVLLAFIVIAVWEDFEEARRTVDREASALVSLYRVSAAVPEPVGPRLRTLADEYARTMLVEEWALLGRGQRNLGSARIVDAFWTTLLAYSPDDDNARLVQGEVLRHLTDLNDSRRARELLATTGLPRVVWFLLIGGGLISIGFTYFFGTPNPLGHYAMTGLFVASIALVVVLIGLLDYPFTGDVRVTPEAFESALATFERLEGR